MAKVAEKDNKSAIGGFAATPGGLFNPPAATTEPAKADEKKDQPA